MRWKPLGRDFDPVASKKKRLRSVRIIEGDWFAVPLRNRAGYAIGVVARLANQGVAFGYFFGPLHLRFPTADANKGLTPRTAVLVACFVGQGLRNGRWPIIVRSEVWDRQKWPVPVFARINVYDQAWRVEYSDDLELLNEKPIRLSKARSLPSDMLRGYVSVEVDLTELLSG